MYLRLYGNSRAPWGRQKGFLLPVALILIVGLAALAGAIVKLSTQSNTSSFREGISMQAFYAAESGGQYAMNQLFFPSASRPSALARCTGMSNENLALSAEGLSGCSVILNCSSSANTEDTISFFTVTSSATCGSGTLLSERVIKASSFIEN